MFSMVSYYFSLVTLSLKRTVFEIIVFTNVVTLMTGLRPSRSLEITPFDKAHTTSFWRSVVTMVLSRVVSEIFNVEKCHDLKLASVVTQCHWKWFLVYSFLLVFFSNFVRKTHRFLDIRLVSIPWPWKPVLGVTQDHWKLYHSIRHPWLTFFCRKSHKNRQFFPPLCI